MTDLTTFRVELDDETVAAVMEQAEAVRLPPRALIAAVVRDTFLAMKAEGVTLDRVALPAGPPSNRRH